MCCRCSFQAYTRFIVKGDINHTNCYRVCLQGEDEVPYSVFCNIFNGCIVWIFLKALCSQLWHSLLITTTFFTPRQVLYQQETATYLHSLGACTRVTVVVYLSVNAAKFICKAKMRYMYHRFFCNRCTWLFHVYSACGFMVANLNIQIRWPEGPQNPVTPYCQFVTIHWFEL